MNGGVHDNIGYNDDDDDDAKDDQEYHGKASDDGGDTFYNDDDDNLKRSDKDKNWMTLVGLQCVISSTFTWNS